MVYQRISNFAPLNVAFPRVTVPVPCRCARKYQPLGIGYRECLAWARSLKSGSLDQEKSLTSPNPPRRHIQGISFVDPPVAPAQSASSVPWDLYSISFADLQKGDTIGVLAREEEGSEHTVTGLMVVTGLGSYGINAFPQAPRHSGLLIRSVDEVARRRLGVSCTNGILKGKVAYRSIEIESTLIVFPLISPVTTTAKGTSWPFSGRFRPLGRFLRNPA